MRGLRGALARAALHYVRLWDCRTANGVDHYLCNSRFVSQRIWKIYRRESTVIYPPVRVNEFPLVCQKENYYLTASRMVPYKRMDLIVEAFTHMPERTLIVIGEGPDYKKIKNGAGSNVRLLGYQSTEVLRDYMGRAKAFVFAAEEDFGIVPVEAQACGTPVIAYKKGGVLETVIEGKTGTFFDEPTVESLVGAIRRFEQIPSMNPEVMRKNAERFGKQRFHTEFKDFMERVWEEHCERCA